MTEADNRRGGRRGRRRKRVLCFTKDSCYLWRREERAAMKGEDEQ